MKVGFFHDAPIAFSDGKYYSRGFGKKIWERYLTVFDELVISTRLAGSMSTGLKVSSRPRVIFQPVTSYSSPKSLLQDFRAVTQQIRENLSQVDAAIVRLPSVIGWLTWAVARRMKKPVLIELVGCPWDAFRSYGRAGSIFAPAAYLFTRLAVLRSDYTIYVTQQFLQQRYPTRGSSIGISNVEIQSDPSRLQQRISKISHPRGHIVLGSMGKIDLRYKGYKTAVEAVQLLRNKGFDVRYEIVGPGNPSELDLQIARLGLNDVIKLVGPLSSSEVDEWLENLDIYIQPSLSEGLPRSVIEAMAHALPVVASEAGGHPELVSENFRFPPGDAQALADRIADVLANDLPAIARQNFEVSTTYEHGRLQKRRELFLVEFKNHVQKFKDDVDYFSLGKNQ